MLRQATIQCMGGNDFAADSPVTTPQVTVNGVDFNVVRFPSGGLYHADACFRFPFNTAALGAVYVEFVGTQENPALTGTVDFDIGIHIFHDGDVIVAPGSQQISTVTCAAVGGRTYMHNWALPITQMYWTPTGAPAFGPDVFGVLRFLRTPTDTLATGFDLMSATVHYRIEA